MTVSLGTHPRESRQGEVRTMIISEKSFETSIPSVMYAITRLTTSRFFSGSRSREGLRSDALSSFTSPFLCITSTPVIAAPAALVARACDERSGLPER